MNAQKRAKELVDKFLNAEFNCKECNMPFCDIPCTKISLFEAKQCAIIAVENEYNSLRILLFNLRCVKVIENEKVYLHRLQQLIDEEKEVQQQIEKL